MLNLVLYEIYCKQKYLKWFSFVVLILKKYQVFYLCPQVVPLAPDRPDTLIKGLLTYSATPPTCFLLFILLFYITNAILGSLASRIFTLLYCRNCNTYPLF